jgi:hypothetical protein
MCQYKCGELRSRAICAGVHASTRSTRLPAIEKPGLLSWCASPARQLLPCAPRGAENTKPHGREVGGSIMSAHGYHVLVEAEEVGRIVLGPEFNQPCVGASERCPHGVEFFTAEEIQQIAAA